jgi:hypothetical protein
MFAVWPACNRDRDLADEPHWYSSLVGCRNACSVVDSIDIVEVDDIIGLPRRRDGGEDRATEGKNYGVGKKYSILSG